MQSEFENSQLLMPCQGGSPALCELRERISELENENACLRALEEVVRRNAHLFRALLAKSHEGLALLTAQMTVLRLVNSVAGNRDAEIAGQPLSSFVHPEDFPAFAKAFDRLLNAKEQCVSCDLRLLRPDGGWIRVSAELTDLLDDPDVQCIVANCRVLEPHS